MAFRDSWHRALVYFGLAEDRDLYEEERGFPGLPLRPGVAVPAGAAAWDTFTRCGTVEDLAAAWAALGGGGLPSA